MEINNLVLFDFSKSSDCLLNNLNGYLLKDKENTFSLEISILPKFKKNEIN
jgi:hypothetical protein